MPIRTAQEVDAEAKRLVNRGIEVAGRFLVNVLKEVLSVPAPRKILTNRKTGVRYYVATIRATPGAPPRKLSGRGRASIASEHDRVTGISRVGTNVKYMARHERENHPWLEITFVAQRGNIESIIGNEITHG